MRLRPALTRLAATTAIFAGLAATAQAAQPLVVYAAIGYDKDMAAAFQKKTGIEVKMVDMSTGPLLARVQAEKDNPQWNVVWFDGAAGMENLAAQGMLAPFAPKADWTATGAKLQPRDHAYTVSATTLAGAIVVNTKTLPKADWPTTWNDLQKPGLKGAVGMNNPAISGPTYPMVAGMMQWQGGVPQGKAWFEKLKANGVHIYNTNGVTLRALDQGQIKAAIVQNSAGIGRAAKGMPFHVIYPEPVSLLPRTMGISAKASPEVRAEAQKFIEFVLSKEGQAVAKKGDPTGDSLYNPLIKGVAAEKGVPDLGALKTQFVDPAIWGPREAAINSWFTDHIVH